MKSLARMLVVLGLAGCAIGTLCLMLHLQAAPVPQAFGSETLRDPASAPPTASEPVSIYVPLAARAIATPTLPYTFALPSNLPAAEALYPLTDAARAHLVQNGFVILEDAAQEQLSAAYTEIEPSHDVAVYVTSDAMLYLFHNVLDDLLKTVEKAAHLPHPGRYVPTRRRSR